MHFFLCVWSNIWQVIFYAFLLGINREMILLGYRKYMCSDLVDTVKQFSNVVLTMYENFSSSISSPILGIFHLFHIKHSGGRYSNFTLHFNLYLPSD